MLHLYVYDGATMAMTMRESWTDDRLDDFARNTDRRFDSLERRMDAGFSEINARLDALQHILFQAAVGLLVAFIGLFGALLALIATQL